MSDGYGCSHMCDTKTSECSTHLAGKALESGALIVAQNMNQPQRAAEMYQRASDLFMTAGKDRETYL